MANENRINFLTRFIRVTLILSILGLAVGYFYVEQTKKDLRKEISNVMDVSLAAVNPERIERQSANPSDGNSADYIRLKEQLLRLIKVYNKFGIDSIYATIINKEKKILFLVDSVEPGAPRYSPPATEYERPPQELFDVFNGRDALIGPYSDEYGTFYTDFSPIKSFTDNKVVGVMGVDMDANYFNGRIIGSWLDVGQVFFVLYIFALMVAFYWDRKEKSRNQLRESQARYAIIFQSSSDAIMTLSPPDWAFSDPNFRTLNLFGAKDKNDFAKYAPWQLSPEKQPDGQLSTDKAKKMIELAIRKGSNFFEWTHKKINGQEFRAEVLLTRFELDGKMVLQANIRDVSERKKKEEELARQKKELEELNDLMVGRETKMIELKEEIQRLKNNK